MTPSAWRARQLEVDAGLAAVQALEEAGAGELDEVAEALVGRGEQREVVALDLALAHGAVVDEVGLEAQDRLDAVLPAGLVELDRAVHDAVVGEAERGLAEGRRAGGQAVDVAAPSSSEYSEWTWRCAQAGVLTEAATIWARSDGAATLPALSGECRSQALRAVQPALEEGDGARSPRIVRAVPGRDGLAAQEMPERLARHRHRRVGAALGRGGERPPYRGRRRR